MARYRKKPVEVEAMRLTEASRNTVMNWMICGGAKPRLRRAPGQAELRQVLVPTLEGNMAADMGDWIIKGVAGEFYPCKPEIFEQTYELVS
ncbi:MAG: hypothetical protein CMF75_08360 [Maricaulis sp.]|nr:hypothetical protein [Maricaulis sp.]